MDVTNDNDYNIDIASLGRSGEGYTTRIGESQERTFVSGIYGVNPAGVPVVISSEGQLGAPSSSRRYKEDIQDMGAASNGLFRLRPVTFRYKKPQPDGSKPLDTDRRRSSRRLSRHGREGLRRPGRERAVQKLTPMLLNELQKQHQELAQQAAPARAECAAEGHLGLALDGLGEQELGGIDAGDQENEGDCATEHEQHRPAAAADRVVQRLGTDHEPGSPLV